MKENFYDDYIQKIAILNHQTADYIKLFCNNLSALLRMNRYHNSFEELKCLINSLNKQASNFSRNRFSDYANNKLNKAQMDAVDSFWKLWNTTYALYEKEYENIKQKEGYIMKKNMTKASLLISGYCKEDPSEIESILEEEYPEFIIQNYSENHLPDGETTCIIIDGYWTEKDTDDFLRLTHHAEAFYDVFDNIHVEVCIDDKWYGGNEHESINRSEELEEERE